ncbi:hypothetical protein CLV30_10562 [Haloactinopolyspora alba]|uniref:SatD family protein n=1 Tax=Haloactinopolyspora alba TaxID=648780 RepID=A0A2P8E554_9ACTN|nr:hypothetical protein [Haloactinopolyspora alba]PSL04598.1 hypothetical protein CLV30_10562 [Haloactinopolyspora alba]
MPYVLTVDQRGSRRGRDLVDEGIAVLRRRIPAPTLPFERTAGDEFQGMLADAADAVDAALALVRHGSWSVGLGVGPADEPLPASTRTARGPAFVHARSALDEAKQRTHHVAVVGADEYAHDADAVLSLLAAVLARRTDTGWEAVDLMAEAHTFADAAERLGVSRQAVGQRLAVALWQQERDVRPVVARLLAKSERAAGRTR